MQRGHYNRNGKAVYGVQLALKQGVNGQINGVYLAHIYNIYCHSIRILTAAPVFSMLSTNRERATERIIYTEKFEKST